MLIDLGANLLPGFVGGSRDIEACAERVTTLYSSGLGAALLTPRYYPAKMSVSEFVGLRNTVLTNLSVQMPKRSPALYLGCEVYVDERLKYISDIGELAVTGTRTIIAVMPEGSWETALLDTLYAVKMADYEVLISHIDRCPDWYAEDLFKLGYRGIVDVEGLVNISNIFRRKQLLDWIDAGYIAGLATNFLSDEKRAHEKILRVHSVLGDKRAEALAESSARALAGAIKITN
jgi:hypothetical protein